MWRRQTSLAHSPEGDRCCTAGLGEGMSSSASRCWCTRVRWETEVGCWGPSHSRAEKILGCLVAGRCGGICVIALFGCQYTLASISEGYWAAFWDCGKHHQQKINWPVMDRETSALCLHLLAKKIRRALHVLCCPPHPAC